MSHKRDMTGGKRYVLRQLFDGFAPQSYGKFTDFRDGVELMPLYGFAQDGTALPGTPSAAVLRYAAGASVPAHYHHGYEHILVLQGSQSDANGSYERGTCVINPPGTSHAVTSEDGCLVLAIWNQPIEMLGATGGDR